MSLFQKSVVNKYLRTLANISVEESYHKFISFYGDKQRLENIKLLKEENYQEGFLREIFVQVLGYTINPDKDYNLTTEFKNQTDARKADGAIIKDGKAIGVIELKSTKTKDLESIKEQAFSYKHHQDNCRYIITSNFEKLRFYIDNATEFEEFNLFDLTENNFKNLYLLLSHQSIFNDIPVKLKEDSKLHEQNISDKLYKDYSLFKQKIFDNLVKNNPQYDKLILFKKSQKLLDRFLFVLFAEDSGLTPPNAISKIIEQWKQLKELDEPVSLYSRFIKLFHHLNVGHKYKNYELHAYNGGLFEKDEILDNVIIDDDVLLQDSLKLSKYNFQTEVDVNILGHIFEHSISEIEELTSELEGNVVDKKKTKRKKEGIFYTPRYITKYIVDNTIGILCYDKKKEFELNDIDISILQKSRTSAGKLNRKAKDFLNRLNQYREYLISLKILDPACGSGAFLNQALEFLINEHQFIDEHRRTLEQDSLGLHDVERSILENNLYGVDINEESVEIAKLSLWLRTAEKGRKLSNLNDNIKCGNSLIDDPEVAGEKAFNWEKEFPQIFYPTQVKTVEIEKEESIDYLSLIEENAKLAQKKAEKATELSKEVINYSKEAISHSKKVYEYVQMQKAIVREPGELYGLNKGGFDVVIGNPPYVPTEYIFENDKKYLERVYNSAFGRINLYPIFYEKGINILKQNGILGFITPYTILKNQYYKEARRFILENTSITTLIDFKGVVVFEDAAVDSIILILKKETKKNNIYNQISNITDFQNIIYEMVSIRQNDILKNVDLSLVVSSNETLIAKISSKTIPLKNIVNFKQGIITGNNKKYLTNVPNNLTQRIITGRDFYKYSICNSNQLIIYDIKELHRPRIPQIFEIKEKILLRQTGAYPICTLDTKQHYTLDTVHNGAIINKEYNSKFILSLLNSELLRFIYENQINETGKVFAQVKIIYIDSLPIKIINEKAQLPFIDKANQMLFLNSEMQKRKNNFLRTVKEDKILKKVTRKLEKYWELTYDEFKKELKKQKITFNLGNENNQWREYFNTNTERMKSMQIEINKTDNEINQMVYKLYNLTDEEIKIVEDKI